MKGGLNFINEQFVDETVAALDKRGCAVYSEKVHGPFREPQIEKESVFKSIAGSVLNPLEDAWKFFQGKELRGILLRFRSATGRVTQILKVCA